MAALRLLLLAALPALAGLQCAGGEVVSVQDAPALLPAAPAPVLPRGADAELECRVLHLADKAISWVRSRDLHILSHAGAVFTADPRVSVAVSGAGGGAGSGAGSGVTRHTLRIAGLRLQDAGRYECQVNTEPKMSQFFNLTVVDEAAPTIVVRALAAHAAARAGGAATLACEARYEPPPRALPLPPLDIRWFFGDQPIDLQSARGGVSLDTERWAARSVARLTLAALAPAHAGRYRCRAGPAAADLQLDVLDVLDEADEAQMETMQRDQSAMSQTHAGGGWRRPAPALLLLPLLLRA